MPEALCADVDRRRRFRFRKTREIACADAIRVDRTKPLEFIRGVSSATDPLRESMPVIPGRCEASNPESRDSGLVLAHHPGMTEGSD